jgi:hypothetical protein
MFGKNEVNGGESTLGGGKICCKWRRETSSKEIRDFSKKMQQISESQVLFLLQQWLSEPGLWARTEIRARSPRK